MIGNTLGHYRIIEKLGAGGMGVVYRADDKTLDRQVAIKVLPEAFTADRERLARFEREAKVLASLNHPNIASIYGLEEAEGKRFLVLELVEGQTVAERLHQGPLPMDETLDIARQITEGLEAAHDKGIVHRDLKPANVKITPEGKVKILDFGLAKALQEEPAAANLSQSPTLTEQLSRPGVILGTAAYMSPEQAKGKPLDKRTDIWAFGCVLYECLTGKRAFEGDTITETIASILKSEPDWTLLPGETPASVRTVLRRCLQKDPNLRLHDIADARVEMREELAGPTPMVPVVQRLPLGWLIASGVTALAIGALIGAAVMNHIKPGPPQTSQPVVRAPIRLEPGHWLDGGRQSPPFGFDHPTQTAMAISSDGRFIVYSAVKENPGPQDKPHLYLRRSDQLEAKPIAGSEGGISPFFSPDDRWVGFWAAGKLMKVSVEGGVPATLCDVSVPFGFSWGADNQVVFTTRWDRGLSRVAADGGKPETLTTPDKSKEYSHRLPQCLPAGKGILFTIMRQPYDIEPSVAVLDLATRKWRVLLEDAADARYVATGHLAFLRKGTLMVIPFDPEKLEIAGQPVPAIANLEQALNQGNAGLATAAGQFSVSASGWLVYAAGGILPDRQNSLVWVDHQGKAEPIASFKAPFSSPRFSPDGRRIAYLTGGMEAHVWVYDLDHGSATRLTSEGWAGSVTWTRDGRRLVFAWMKTGAANIYWQPVDGSSPMERLTQSQNLQRPGSWSPDGKMLAFVEQNQENLPEIELFNISDHRVTPPLNSRFYEGYPEFSPDGRWMAYVSGESGRLEVYVQPFPGRGGKQPISNDGGEEPLWAPNGKQLFYRSGNQKNQVWLVDVQTGSGFSAGKPRLLFDQPGYGEARPIRGWDISPDGKRFLMVKLEERKSQPITEMILVQNWFEELKRLAPTGK
jgi:serine/threonine-protein kinase